MNITANAASLDWRSNKHGVWKALVKDMAPNSSVTFSGGLTGTVAGKQVTVESTSVPTGFMTYTTDITDCVVGSMLYGAGSVSDGLEAVSGGKTVRMGSVDLGTLNWKTGSTEGYFYCDTLSDIAKGVSGMVISSKLEVLKTSWASASFDSYPDNVLGKTAGNKILYVKCLSFTTEQVAEFKAYLSGVILYYELAEPVTSTETAQSLALQTGVNNLALNERDSSFTLDYIGTDFTLQLDSTHKYAFSDNGVKSVLTGSTEQAVTGGQDMLVDVTRMFNGDTTVINAVTSWADMAAVMPEYLSNVAYNEGEVVGRSGGVTTVKWNQLVQNGNFADGTEGWIFNGTSGVVVDDYVSITKTAALGLLYQGSRIKWRTGRVYVVDIYARPLVENLDMTFMYAQVSTAVHLPVGELNTWAHMKLISTAKGNDNNTRIYFNQSSSAHVNEHVADIKFVQVFDLTEIYGAGHEPSTVEGFEADCTKWGKDLSQYQAYDAGTPMGGSATFTGLHGIGTAKDTQDVVTGEKTVRMGSYTFTGNEGWTSPANRPYTWYMNNFTNAARSPLVGPYTFILVGYIPGYVSSSTTIATVDVNVQGHSSANQIWIYDPECDTVDELKAKITGRVLHYELAEPVTSTETPQPLTTIKGLNNVHEENMSITGTPLALGYTGTDQTISADTTSKYLARIDGADSMLENVSSIDVRGGRDRVVDMTYMFGAGNEPATAADFYKLFPTWMGYAIPYNKGSLVNFKGTGLKSVGFNLLDIEADIKNITRTQLEDHVWINGVRAGDNTWSPTNGFGTINGNILSVTGNSYGCAYSMRALPGMTYEIEFTRGQTAGICNALYYKYDGSYIDKSSDLTSTGSVTVPANTYWMLILFRCGASNVTYSFTNICVHLQWSGGRNGDYEPYWDYVRPMPTLTYFPSGMNGRGGVYDETTSRQAVTRLAEVDMEDLEWTESNGSWTATVSGMKAGTSAIVAENGLKPVVSGTSVTVQSETSPVGKLVYELANPSTVTFPEEANVTAQVSDYGTESVVPVNGYELVTAPFLGIVKYQDNYARTITKLPENYQSQDSMDALQLVLGQLLNVTLTSRFNADEQAYGYTVTGDGVPGLIAAALTALAPVTGLTFRGGTYMPTDGMVALPDPTIQGITTIPASTSSYTLGEGVYSHEPNSVPTYTLPAVEDATVVHKAKLTVKMSASVLTANFRNGSGVAISYEAPAGDVRAGTLVEYICTYEPLAGGWAVSARVVMQTA